MLPLPGASNATAVATVIGVSGTAVAALLVATDAFGSLQPKGMYSRV